MGDLIKFPLLRRQDAIALEETCECGMWPIEEYGEICPSCDFGIEVSEEEFNTTYAPTESFEGTYDGVNRDDRPPRLIGSAAGEWLHQTLRNAGRCARCGNPAHEGWSWFDPTVTKGGDPVAQQFTCDDCAESL